MQRDATWITRVLGVLGRRSVLRARAFWDGVHRTRCGSCGQPDSPGPGGTARPDGVPGQPAPAHETSVQVQCDHGYTRGSVYILTAMTKHLVDIDDDTLGAARAE